MTRIPALATTATGQQPFGPRNVLNEINLDTFLQLMITELQNQDPLNPLENDQLLAQISQIREVGATDRLTETLDSVLLGQNIASATNLIGADVRALSDDGQQVEGIVGRVSIDGGQPKLHLELPTAAAGWSASGEIETGEYRYRIVWADADGTLFGIDLKDEPVVTTGTDGVDTSIRLSNLPATTGPKHIFRTDSSGRGDYLLVETLHDGAASSFVDTLADDDRRPTQLTDGFQRLQPQRSFTVSLDNVAEIRPPGP